MAWHRRAFWHLAMDLRAQKAAGKEFLVLPRAIGGVGPDIASGVVSIDQLGQQCAVGTGRVCHPPAGGWSRPSIDAEWGLVAEGRAGSIDTRPAVVAG